MPGTSSGASLDNAEQRSHLDLQVNVLAERKIAKLIALLGELRRDLPMVKNRVDQEADSMQEAADPAAMMVALGKTAESPGEAAGGSPDELNVVGSNPISRPGRSVRNT